MRAMIVTVGTGATVEDGTVKLGLFHDYELAAASGGTDWAIHD